MKALFKDINKFVEMIDTPEGFEKTFGEEDYWQWRGELAPVLRFKNATEEIAIVFDKTAKGNDKWVMIASGHTHFNTDKGRMTFDRRGVEDSFYINNDDTVKSVNEKIADQIKRIAESRDRLAKSVKMPVYGYCLTPESLAFDKAKLNEGKIVQHAPAGFGTGHFFSKDRRRLASYAKRCKPEVETFYGISPLFVEEFDHD